MVKRRNRARSGRALLICVAAIVVGAGLAAMGIGGIIQRLEGRESAAAAAGVATATPTSPEGIPVPTATAAVHGNHPPDTTTHSSPTPPPNPEPTATTIVETPPTPTETTQPTPEPIADSPPDTLQPASSALAPGVSTVTRVRVPSAGIDTPVVQVGYTLIEIQTLRAEMMRAYWAAAGEVMQEHSDLLRGFVWQAVLDNATCAICVWRHGRFYTLEELEEIERHLGCRCGAIPWAREWGDPGAAVPARGQPQIKPGGIWFAEQDMATKRTILGPAKLLAYERGELSLGDLAGVKQHPRWGPTLYERSLRSIVGQERAEELIREVRHR